MGNKSAAGGKTGAEDSSAGRHIAINLIGETLSRVPQIAAELIFARLLGPASYGIWKSLQLMLNVCNFTNLGIPAGLGKELPRVISQDDPDKVLRMERVSLGGLAGVLTVVVVVLILMAQIPAVLGALGIQGHAGLYYLNILNLWASQFLVLYQVYLRSQLRFAEVALGTSIFAVIFLVLGVPATMHFGPGGIVMSYCLGCVLAILYTQARLKRLILPVWHSPTLKLLIRQGLPLVAYGAVQWLFLYTDRLLIITLFGTSELGRYGFAMILPMAVTVVSTTIPRAVLPILMRRLGAASQLSDSTLLFLVTVLVLSWSNGVVIGLLLPASTAMVALFMPEYIDVMSTMWILLFNTFIWVLSTMALPYSIAGEHQVKMNLIGATSLVVNVIVGYTLVSMGWGIIGVAAAASLGQTVFLLQLYLDVTRLMKIPTGRAWHCLWFALLPGLMVLALWLAGDRVVGWQALMTGEWFSLWTASAWAAVNIMALAVVGLFIYGKIRMLQKEYGSQAPRDQGGAPQQGSDDNG